MKDILEEYDVKKVIYLEYEEKIISLIRSLLKEHGITIHAIESRVKDKKSLEKKIERKDGKYSTLDEITDTVGLRIITYFEDDVDKIAEILEEEFYLDTQNSVDKRNSSNPEAFGYASLHYILRLKEPRASLPEYQRFNFINFEIQIRSILQHAWAEIEHDIGYKSSVEIPKDIRRNFSRVSSLLELADIEFIRIKKEISEYSIKVKENIQNEKLDIPLDKVTLEEFITDSKVVRELDEFLLDKLNGDHIEFEKNFSERTLIRLKLLEISSVEELKNKLESKKTKIKKFATIWLSDSPREEVIKSIAMGLSIFYLMYVLAGESENENFVIEYAKTLSEYEKEELAERIIETINSI
ncbi:hypothetical protein F0342_21565 [Bacillus sp. CH30_1T]|uniref:GTP pyrophosphokinase n=1 Tax=Bacillus sp. CH30_1T TaxID=2604836 RepID=UPI0011ED233D|nr:hypothetical protein [Bacillus sp. CH30_1T]KAA0560752.1 hypothetical protein F0342_21565 [Bacillus sp. CH30_1T]